MPVTETICRKAVTEPLSIENTLNTRGVKPFHRHYSQVIKGQKTRSLPAHSAGILIDGRIAGNRHQAVGPAEGIRSQNSELRGRRTGKKAKTGNQKKGSYHGLYGFWRQFKRKI